MEIDVANGQPSDVIIEANMRDLARYALICQAEGLVPIVEPDVSLKGDHDLETARLTFDLHAAVKDYFGGGSGARPDAAHGVSRGPAEVIALRGRAP